MLFACLVLGVVLRRSGRLPETAPAAFNGFILNAALPALILLQIHAVRFTPALLFPAAMPWLMFAIGCGFFFLLGRALRFTPETTGALTIAGGLANTSFVGLPMIEAFYGRADMAIGIVVDQLGTYLVLSTLGLAVIAFYARADRRTFGVVRRIATFPPLIALVIACVPVAYPTWLVEVLRRLGDTVAPLALVSVGLQLSLASLRGNLRALAGGLAFKLALGPLAVMAVYVWLLHAHGETIRVTLFEAAMGPQIGGAVVASQSGLDPPLISLLVAIGITLSFATLPVWWYVLQAV
jgi:predicted permease